MIIIFSSKKIVISILIFLLFISGLGIYLWFQFNSTITVFMDEELTQRLSIDVQEIFRLRNDALLREDPKLLESLYNTQIRNALWAYEHELKKMKYLKEWSDKQSIILKEIDSHIVLTKVKPKEDGFSIILMVSTEYQYAYRDSLEVLNSFRLGAYHSLDIVPHEEAWIIIKEWYGDPMGGALCIDESKKEDLRQLIVSEKPKDLSNLNQKRIDAVAYAHKYCGTASLPEYGFKYNSAYGNFNSQGGDCANFASQMLYEAGVFKKNSVWNFEKRKGSKAWLNAHTFNNYMLNSGRGSVIARGSYEQVLKSSYKLLPGDYVAYEKKGKVTHISIVTEQDSKGYALVNSHNADRYRVPWDMGWNSKGIRFHLIRVHY